MKGPVDERVEAQLPQETAEPEIPVKPAGGKALMRMISHLQRRGLYDLADDLVEVAVPEDARAAVEAARVRLSAAPRRLSEEAAATAPRRRGRGSAEERARPATEEGTPTAAAVAAPNVSEEYARAAADLGTPTSPPTPTGPQWRSLGPWTIPNGQTYGAAASTSPAGSPRSRSTRQPGARAMRRRRRRRLGELRPGRAVGRRAPTTRRRSRSARSPPTAPNPTVLLRDRRGQLVGLPRRRGCCARPTAVATWSTLCTAPVRRTGLLRPASRPVRRTAAGRGTPAALRLRPTAAQRGPRRRRTERGPSPSAGPGGQTPSGWRRAPTASTAPTDGGATWAAVAI